jgi:hypothetical protein
MQLLIVFEICLHAMTRVTEPMKEGWQGENPRGKFGQKYSESFRHCDLLKLEKLRSYQRSMELTAFKTEFSSTFQGNRRAL